MHTSRSCTMAQMEAGHGERQVAGKDQAEDLLTEVAEERTDLSKDCCSTSSPGKQARPVEWMPTPKQRLSLSWSNSNKQAAQGMGRQEAFQVEPARAMPGKQVA